VEVGSNQLRFQRDGPLISTELGGERNWLGGKRGAYFRDTPIGRDKKKNNVNLQPGIDFDVDETWGGRSYTSKGRWRPKKRGRISF